MLQQETNGNKTPDLMAFMTEYIKSVAGELSIDPVKLKALVEVEVAKAVKPKEVKIIITKDGKDTPHEGVEHNLFPLVLTILKAKGVNLALTGGAGSGKTTCLMNAARALEVTFYLQPFNIMSTKSDILGYMDANGRYVESAFYKAFKDGAMFIADEFDCCHPAVATLLNAAIANRVLTFGNNETVVAHADFRASVCMNTIGAGATIQYVGRNALDAATLDRFVMLHFNYDESLEASLVGIQEPVTIIDINDGGTGTANEWLKLVRATRAIVEKLGLQNIISPRATIMGVELMKAGVGRKWLTKLILFKGMSEDQERQVKAELKKDGK